MTTMMIYALVAVINLAAVPFALMEAIKAMEAVLHHPARHVPSPIQANGYSNQLFHLAHPCPI
jgi:hypothetical protein